MILLAVNLARSPFANTRPIVRVAIVLWTVAVLLGVYNGVTYWHSFSGSEATKVKLETNKITIQEAHESIKAAEITLASLQLREQNETVHFLNARIAERTFPWSLLFDSISEILPNGVRLVSLKPTPTSRTGSRQSKKVRVADSVHLGIHAVAKKDADLLDFIDELFSSEAFEKPRLSKEKRTDSGEIDFHLTTDFLLDVAAKARQMEVATEDPEVPEGVTLAEDTESAPSENDGTAIRGTSSKEPTGMESVPAPVGSSPVPKVVEKTTERKTGSTPVQRPTRGSQERTQPQASPRTRVSPEVRTQAVPRTENREVADPLRPSPRPGGIQVPGVAFPQTTGVPTGGVVAPGASPPAVPAPEVKPWRRNENPSPPGGNTPVPLSPTASSSRRLR